MAESTTIVSLPQLVDLALNCPEMGSFNFGILHILLHVLLKQLDRVSDVSVEFRGDDSQRMQSLITATRPSANLGLSEYTIVGGGKRRRLSKDKKGVSLQEIREMSKEEVMTEEELRIIEQRKDSKQDPSPSPEPLKSPPGSKRGSRTVVVVDSSSKLPQLTVAMSKEHFESLQIEVKTIKEKLKELTELPANMGLIEATRTGSTPILDMFQILQLTKRMDACEGGMQKIVSLVEDLARETAGGPQAIEEIKQAMKTEDVGRRMSKLSAIMEDAAAIKHSMSDTRKTGSEGVEKRITRLEKDIENLIEDVAALGKSTPSSKSAPRLAKSSTRSTTPKSPKSPSSGKSKSGDGATTDEETPAAEEREKESIHSVVMVPSAIAGIDLADIPASEAMILIQQELENLRGLSAEVQKIKDQLTVDSSDLPVDAKMALIEDKFAECVNQMTNLDTTYNVQIGGLHEQLQLVQTEVGNLLDKINQIMQGGDSVGANVENTTDLYNKLLNLEQEMAIIAETATKLQEEKHDRDKNIDSIKEQIDLLKIVKANREDLEDALGDKADACMINRKVSHDQFDAACDDLSKGIEEALGKLSQQEEMWHQALDTIQREVGNKLDKMEVDPLRDFVNSKLKALQEKFKALTSLRREQEAAGTKSKIMRNVNCISCDKDVVMRREMDVTLRPQPYAMPPSKNIAPYLAYELDQLRKQQKCAPNSKNLNFLESALKTKGAKEKDHVCNRYCGGSHTVTTPQQRVTRLGHFLEQWGPEIAPLNDEYIRGKDNQMYKARDDNQLKKMAAKDAKRLSAKGSEQKGLEEVVSKDTETPRTEGNVIVNADAQELITDAAAKGRQKTSLEEVLMKPPESAAVPVEDDISFLKTEDNTAPASRRQSASSAKRLSAEITRKFSDGNGSRKLSGQNLEKRASKSSSKKLIVDDAINAEEVGDTTANERRPSDTTNERRPSDTANERRPSDTANERRPSDTANERPSNAGDEEPPPADIQE